MSQVPYREHYAQHTRRKLLLLVALVMTTAVVAIVAVRVGAVGLSTGEVLRSLVGLSEKASSAIVWNVRLPRVATAVVAGAGLAVAGAVMQSVLRNPLASPFTLGISQGAAFGAAVAIVGLGAGVTGSASADAVRVMDAWSVAGCAFAGSMVATLTIVAFAKYRGVSPQTMVLAGVALGSLFSAGTVLLQYFAEDAKVAAVVFWTFGDLGRASWRDVAIMATTTVLGSAYFMWHRWDYNAMEAGSESARGLGVNVDRTRLAGMFVASLVTASVVAFLGIIGFIGLVGPHMVRRVIGSDHRFLLPASVAAGALLLLVSDTLARVVVSPVVLPVGAITSLLGAPLFLYLLTGRGSLR